MKCTLRIASCTVVAQVLSLFTARESVAVPITLNLVKASSHILQTGDFSTLPMLAQDGLAGTTDGNAALPSNDTTFQGTITVDIDSLVAPTSIRILSSAADADPSGSWLPEVEPFLDVDGDLNFGEFGQDSVTTVGDNPAPATSADWGIRVFHPAFGANIAYGSARDIAYNITMPAAVPLNGLGEFNSSTQNFEFSSGWFDYWVAPGAGTIRGRSELAGGDDNNSILLPSTFVATPLGGGLTQYTLTIPIDINAPGGDANFFYDGLFVATTIVPEPTSFVLLGTTGVVATLFGRRKR